MWHVVRRRGLSLNGRGWGSRCLCRQRGFGEHEKGRRRGCLWWGRGNIRRRRCWCWWRLKERRDGYRVRWSWSIARRKAPGMEAKKDQRDFFGSLYKAEILLPLFVWEDEELPKRIFLGANILPNSLFLRKGMNGWVGNRKQHNGCEREFPSTPKWGFSTYKKQQKSSGRRSWARERNQEIGGKFRVKWVSDEFAAIATASCDNE